MGVVKEIIKSSEIRLIICGGGHVARELAELSSFMGYRTTVIENRREYISAQRFPYAERIIGEYEKILSRMDEPGAYYVIVTPGHEYDIICLREILKKDYAYLGMIGSRKKVKYCFELMMREGVSEEKLKTVDAPIGIPILSHTPKEIAVSIIAGIIRTRNSVPRRYETDAETVRRLAEERGRIVCARVASKRGSAPRGAGACLFVCESGTVLGTVGGGIWEAKVIDDARAVLAGADIKKKTYGTHDLGAQCGGEIDVDFEVDDEAD